MSVLLAFLPAAVIGAIAHDFIKTVLFETPILICVVLIIGGFILLAIDRMPLKPTLSPTSWTIRRRWR